MGSQPPAEPSHAPPPSRAAQRRRAKKGYVICIQQRRDVEGEAERGESNLPSRLQFRRAHVATKQRK